MSHLQVSTFPGPSPSRARSALRVLLLDNPIVLYDGLLGTARRAHARKWVYTIAAVGTVVTFGSAFLTAIVPYDRALPRIGVSLVLFWGALTVITSALQAARVVVQAREQGTWDGLVMSRLRSVEVVIGKLAAALLPSWASWLLILPGAFILFSESRFGLPAIGLFLLGAFLRAAVLSLAFASLALYGSMRSKTLGAAYAFTFQAMVLTSLFGWLVPAGPFAYLPPVQRVSYLIDLFGLGGWTYVLLETETYGLAPPMPWSQVALLSVPGFGAFLLLVLRFKSMDRRHRH